MLYQPYRGSCRAPCHQAYGNHSISFLLTLWYCLQFVLYVQRPRNVLNCYPNERLLAFRTRLVCLTVWRGTRYAANVIRRRFDGLEEDVYVESWEARGAGIDICYCGCEGLFGGGGGEGARWVVDYPERHDDGL
jgi:hypothetical protein